MSKYLLAGTEERIISPKKPFEEKLHLPHVLVVQHYLNSFLNTPSFWFQAYLYLLHTLVSGLGVSPSSLELADEAEATTELSSFLFSLSHCFFATFDLVLLK